MRPFRAQYLAGHDMGYALKQSGATCTVRNINKRAKATGQERAVLAVTEVAGPAPPRARDPRKSGRTPTKQFEKNAADKHRLKRMRIEAFKEVTLELQEYHAARAAGGARQPGKSAHELTVAKNATLAPSVKPLSERSVREAAEKGRAGESPRKPGLKSAVPAVLIDVAHSWVGVQQQVSEPKPRELQRRMRAAVAETTSEGALVSYLPGQLALAQQGGSSDR